MNVSARIRPDTITSGLIGPIHVDGNGINNDDTSSDDSMDEEDSPAVPVQEGPHLNNPRDVSASNVERPRIVSETEDNEGIEEAPIRRPKHPT